MQQDDLCKDSASLFLREQQFLDSKVKKLALKDAQYHLLLCCHQTIPKCCTAEVGANSWEYLKKRIVELGLSKSVYRSRANCLQICYSGPILVVYPDGVWYRSCSAEIIERVLQEHILQGSPVTDYILCEKFLNKNG